MIILVFFINYRDNIYEQNNRRKIILENLDIRPAKRCPKNKNIDCNICISLVESTELIRQLNCKHIFHKKCIDTWFIKCDEDNIHCPMCRCIV